MAVTQDADGVSGVKAGKQEKDERYLFSRQSTLPR